MNILERLVSPFSGGAKTTDKAKRSSVKNKLAKQNKVATVVKVNPYRAVSINFENCACDAVRAIGKKRFLVSEGNAPMLPLPDCDAASCSCRYEHHEDRRDYESGDRRHYSALKTNQYEADGSANRRKKKRGRRKTDV